MRRALVSLAALIATGFLAGPGFAADWTGQGDDAFRSGYPTDWEMSDDSLHFDIGVRYWYAMGSQNFSVFGSDFSSEDQGHILEGHFKIEDDATSSYVKAFAGYAGAIGGTYSTPGVTDAPIQGGTIGYAQGDFGWMPLGDANFRFGGVVGYQYWNDSPDMGRANFTTATGGASEANDFNINSLRLGVTSKFDVNNAFDITAEAVAVPFGWVNGTLGAYGVPDRVINGATYTQSSAMAVNGRLWGGQAELLFGLHPTDNLTFRFGGRAWYLTGPVEATFSMANVAAPGQTQAFIGNLDNFSLFRYGAVAELSYSF